MQVFAVAVQHDKSITGLDINNAELKMIYYTDDTTGIFKNTNQQKNFLKLLEKFHIASGLKVNKEKTEAMWIGKTINLIKKNL
jgi:hypothetical protein